MPRKGDLVHVEWDDAVAVAKWVESDEAAEVSLSHAESTGWLVGGDRTALRICATRGDEGRMADITVIPKGSVTKITRLQKRGT